FVLDEKHLYAAVRYVERNPVRAKIVRQAEDYKYSSARLRVNKTMSDLLDYFYMIDEVNDWRVYLQEEEKEEDLKLFRRHGATGRPLGDPMFIERLSRYLDRDLMKKKPGPKPRLGV
ncbi:MAG: transposase, partial [Candidatus Omnitrophica bacterium]|nr:transposase [Candidatus Omnitrophota bacterium]